MKNFYYLTPEERQAIFYLPPAEIDRNSNKETLAHALGATLYIPSTRETFAGELISGKYKGLMSLVICLEDAIGDNKVREAEQSLQDQLKRLEMALAEGEIDYLQLPLLFVRIRSEKQLAGLAEQIGETLKLLTGFVFPKFCYHNGSGFFDALKKINNHLGKQLYAMPILETADIIYQETRVATLTQLQGFLAQYQDLVLNLRIGATDFSSLFGIRRSDNVTIYDISVIRDCIGDIVNTFCRIDQGYVVSGPVWEYFGNENRADFIREIILDKANGLIGKTIIHPTHIAPVQAMSVVKHEEYMDAESILANNNGEQGAMKSPYANKMNEIKPHLNWAKKIILQAKIYGVFNEQKNFTSLQGN